MKKVFYLSILSLMLCFSCADDGQKNNTLNLYLSEIIPGVDPITIRDRHSHEIARQIYDGLYEYNYVKSSFQLYPVLAEGMPEVSKDGLTYTIKLKQGVRFSDDPCFKNNNEKGRELVAEDVVYSLKRSIVTPETQSMFFSMALVDIIKGADEFKKRSVGKKDLGIDEQIEGLKALDKYTVQFNLKKTASFFPVILIRPNAFIVPREAVEHYGAEFKYHPVGSGAFMVQNWEKDAEKNLKISLVKNPNYKHGKFPSFDGSPDEDTTLLRYAGKEIPFIDKIVYHILLDDAPRWMNFNKGLIDIVILDKDSYFDAFPTSGNLSKSLENKGIHVHKTQRLETTYFSFNMEDKIIGNNKYLRQAIALAYDGKKHNALFYNNQAVVANWLIPPGIFGFDPNYKNPYRQHDIEKAKKLMVKAGYPAGKGLPPLSMLLTDSIASKQIGEFFAKSLSEIGVKINFTPMNLAKLDDEVSNKRNYQILSFQWKADIPIPEDFLRLLYSKAVYPGPNDSRFKNAEYDSLFEKVSVMKEGPDKLKLLARMRAIAEEECPLMTLVNPHVIRLSQPYIENYRPHIIIDNMYKYVKINSELREEVHKKYYR
jgi:oligopeptide transport system substrate-binding protein